MRKVSIYTEPNPSNITKWCDALRSGRYKQNKFALHNVSNDSYCCLGVACDVFIEKDKQNTHMLGGLVGGTINDDTQPNAPEWLKDICYRFESRTGMALIKMNDGGIYSSDDDSAFTFDEIADVLELVYVHKAL